MLKSHRQIHLSAQSMLQRVPRLLALIIFWSTMLEASSVLAERSRDLDAPTEQALRELRSLLDGQDRFARVHAAESLIEFGESSDAYKVFLSEWNTHRDTPGYRVVVMRVLSHASPTESERRRWMNRIRDVFLDATQPDRLHASECLAKLRYQVADSEVDAFEKATLSDNPSIAVFANWILASSGHEAHNAALFAYLRHSDPTGRYCAAYALRHLKNDSSEVLKQLFDLAANEPESTLPKAYALSAAFVLAPDDELRSTLRDRMIDVCRSGNKDEVREICAAFAIRGNRDDIPEMKRLMGHENADIREAAARSVVCISKRLHLQEKQPKDTE